jgi:hypothetical protein
MSNLGQLRTWAQQRADRSNFAYQTGEVNALVNASVQELYATLTSTYEDYNCKRYQFTLLGGDPPGNVLNVGFGTSVPDFLFMRGLWWQAQTGPGIRYLPLTRLASMLERARYVGPSISLYYGQVTRVFDLYGNTLEVLPGISSAGTYMLTYVPSMPTLVNDSDTIDQYWLSTLGWDEYVVLDVASKLLIKEESLDTAQILTQQKGAIRDRIMREAKPRDDSQPGQIADVEGARRNFGTMGWGSGGAGPWGGW